ncbi:hypothetical protein ACJX0J_023471, partial [Zea mays]
LPVPDLGAMDLDPEGIFRDDSDEDEDSVKALTREATDAMKESRVQDILVSLSALTEEWTSKSSVQQQLVCISLKHWIDGSNMRDLLMNILRRKAT